MDNETGWKLDQNTTRWNMDHNECRMEGENEIYILAGGRSNYLDIIK